MNNRNAKSFVSCCFTYCWQIVTFLTYFYLTSAYKREKKWNKDMRNETPTNDSNIGDSTSPDVNNEVETAFGTPLKIHTSSKIIVSVAIALLSAAIALSGVATLSNLPSSAATANVNPLISCAGVQKPVIYLYPEEITNVSVALNIQHGDLTFTYPKYGINGWNVIASPDGNLLDESGNQYNYLYWEGAFNASWDFSEGFCVKGEDTAIFLEHALEKLGLNRKEANEFIVYWLPMMEDNEYNIISFQTTSYTDNAELQITPKPDTTIRVMMAWKPSDKKVDIQPQVLSAPERSGFTVVEWGGSQVPAK